MSNPLSPRQESSSTYITQDRKSEEELHSQHILDKLMTASMGGVLAEQPDPTIFQQILDVGCGTGDWLFETANKYPTASQLVGIDTNERMLTYARTQAAAQALEERVQFSAMDARHTLNFPSDSFDLVNQRLGANYLRTWDWLNFLSELRRVTLPDGIIRLTETRAMESNSPALKQFTVLLEQAMHQSGHTSAEEGGQLIETTIKLMKQLDIQNIQTRDISFKYPSNPTEGQYFHEEMKYTLRTFQPFVSKWVHIDNYETLMQQALHEIQEPEFVGTWHLVTIWGSNRK